MHSMDQIIEIIRLNFGIRPLHTAEKHRPTMFHTGTVRPKRSGPSILYNTHLRGF